MWMTEGAKAVKTKGMFFLRFAYFILFFIVLFIGGCNQRQSLQREVDLYVDAVMLRELGEDEMAVEKLSAAVEQNEEFSLAYSLLGEIYQQLSDYGKSAAFYEKAVEINPWSFKDYFNLGRVYELMEKFANAVRAYSRACELKPYHLQSHINAARNCYRIADFSRALTYGRKAEQIDPNVGEVQSILGDIYELQKDYDQAVSHYKRSLEIDSSDAEIMTSLAIIYLKTGREEAAKELLTSVVEIVPHSNRAFQYLGYCYVIFYDKLVNSHRQLLETEPDNLEELNRLKTDAEEAMSRAIANYERAIAIDEMDWQARRGLGVAYMLKGLNKNDQQMKEKAIEQWGKCLQIKPDQPRRERLIKLMEKYSSSQDAD
jgi:tetratricopeptide (TPR) repeat protein